MERQTRTETVDGHTFSRSYSFNLDLHYELLLDVMAGRIPLMGQCSIWYIWRDDHHDHGIKQVIIFSHFYTFINVISIMELDNLREM